MKTVSTSSKLQAPNYSRGFTLVELLVAAGLFAVIMTLSAGSYLVMVGIHNRAQAIALAGNNLSFVLENMTRSIRTGGGYECEGEFSCSQGDELSFVDSTGRNVCYRLQDSAIEQSVDGCLPSSGWVQLTDPSVTVELLDFYLSDGDDTESSNYGQPFVRMVVHGTVDIGHGESVTFAVQTAATMRGIDL